MKVALDIEKLAGFVALYGEALATQKGLIAAPGRVKSMYNTSLDWKKNYFSFAGWTDRSSNIYLPVAVLLHSKSVTMHPAT